MRWLEYSLGLPCMIMVGLEVVKMSFIVVNDVHFFKLLITPSVFWTFVGGTMTVWSTTLPDCTSESFIQQHIHIFSIDVYNFSHKQILKYYFIKFFIFVIIIDGEWYCICFVLCLVPPWYYHVALKYGIRLKWSLTFSNFVWNNIDIT